MLRILLKKEWWLWWASPVHFVMPFLFTLIVMTIFGIMWQSPVTHELIICSVFINLLFAGVLRFIKGSDPENEASLFLYYRMVPRVALPILFSKLIMNYVYLLALFVLSFVILSFYLPVSDLPAGAGIKLFLDLCAPFGLWLFGFCLLGTVFSGMLLGYEKRDSTLSLLLYPFVLPIIIALLKGFHFSAEGQVIDFDNSWLYFLALFDGIYLFLCLYVQEVLFEL